KLTSSAFVRSRTCFWSVVTCFWSALICAACVFGGDAAVAAPAGAASSAAAASETAILFTFPPLSWLGLAGRGAPQSFSAVRLRTLDRSVPRLRRRPREPLARGRAASRRARRGGADHGRARRCRRRSVRAGGRADAPDARRRALRPGGVRRLCCRRGTSPRANRRVARRLPPAARA